MQEFWFDYLSKLGITLWLLLPVYDFGSVDEEDQWSSTTGAMDPVQYNVPEGAMRVIPNDPYARILELQDTIDYLSPHLECHGCSLQSCLLRWALLNRSFLFFYRYTWWGRVTMNLQEWRSECSWWDTILAILKQWVSRLDGSAWLLMGIRHSNHDRDCRRTCESISLVSMGKGEEDTGLEDQPATNITRNDYQPFGLFQWAISWDTITEHL